jgi:hypothetical protein
MPGPLEKFMARLCLLAAVLMGLSPDQGLVLCVGPEGTYTLEVASDESSCDGCPEVSDPARGGEEHATLEDPATCPCSDYPVLAGSSEARSKPKLIDIDLGQLARIPVPFGAAIDALCVRRASATPRVGPGIDPRLTELRTVVLRV